MSKNSLFNKSQNTSEQDLKFKRIEKNNKNNK